MSHETKRDGNGKPHTRGPAEPITSLYNTHKKKILGTLISAGVATLAMCIKPVQNALIPRLMNTVFPESVEVKVAADHREVAVGDRVHITLSLIQKSLFAPGSGKVIFSSPAPSLRADSALQMDLPEGFKDYRAFPSANGLEFEAIDTGSVRIFGVYETASARHVSKDTLVIKIQPRSRFGAPTNSDLTGRWTITGLLTGELSLQQGDGSILSGFYSLESGEKGTIRGSREGRPVNLIFENDSPLRWHVIDAKLCRDGDYLNIRGSVQNERIAGSAWQVVPGRLPGYFMAFAKVSIPDMARAHDCDNPSTP